MKRLEEGKINPENIDVEKVPNLGRPFTNSTIKVEQYEKSIEEYGYLSDLEKIREGSNNPEADHVIVWRITKEMTVDVDGQEVVLKPGDNILIDGGHRVEAVKRYNRKIQEGVAEGKKDIMSMMKQIYHTIPVVFYEFDTIEEARAFATGRNTPKEQLVSTPSEPKERAMNVVKNFRSYEKNGNYDQYKNSKGMFTMANIKKILRLPEYKPFALSDADIEMTNSSKAGPVAKYVQENWYKQRSKHCYAPVDKRDVRSYINDHWKKLGLDGPVDWTFFSAAQSRSERNTGYGKVQGVPTLITVMCQDGIQNYSKTLKSHCDELKEKGVNMRQLERIGFVYHTNPYSDEVINSTRNSAAKMLFEIWPMIKSTYDNCLGTKLYTLGQTSVDEHGALMQITDRGEAIVVEDED